MTKQETNRTPSGFSLVEDSPDDLVVKQNGVVVCKIDVVDKECVWLSQY